MQHINVEPEGRKMFGELQGNGLPLQLLSMSVWELLASGLCGLARSSCGLEPEGHRKDMAKMWPGSSTCLTESFSACAEK